MRFHGMHLEGTEVCPVCGIRKVAGEIKSHMAYFHGGGGNCPVCGKYFITRFKLQLHVHSYCTVVDITCICGKKFKNKGSYRNHFRLNKCKK